KTAGATTKANGPRLLSKHQPQHILTQARLQDFVRAAVGASPIVAIRKGGRKPVPAQPDLADLFENFAGDHGKPFEVTMAVCFASSFMLPLSRFRQAMNVQGRR